MKKISINMMVLAALTLMTGCSPTIVTSEWVDPLCISHDDVLTDGTKRQVLTHNETLGKPCE